MARYDRISRKIDVKSPDEFLTFWDHAFHWVADNRDRLLLPVLGGVVAVVLAFGFYYYQTQKEAKANEELYRVLAQLPRQGSGAATTAQEMIEKLKAYDAQFGGGDAGRIGKFYRANILYQKKSFEDAIALYKDVLDGDLLGQYAAINLAAAYTEQGRYADAAATLEKIRATTYFAEEVEYQIARNQEAANNMAAAKAEYQKYLEKHPGSRYSVEAKDRLARLS